MSVGDEGAVPRVVLASRGDALTPYLLAALERQCQVVGRMSPDLTTLQRLVVAGTTFRPSRRAWAERFFKSALGHRLRSRNAGRQIAALGVSHDVVLQVHSLFDVPGASSVLYIDCTHRQSAEQWPDWNPLRGNELEAWYARERAELHRAVHVFSFSEQTRRSIIDDYGVPAERVTRVGAGSNLKALPVIDRSRRTPTVLFIGNDFVRKGGEVLLEAFRAVKEAVPEAILQLVGTEHHVAAQDGVQVLGRIHDRTRIAQLYAEASVFTMPSYFDPYALVLLEAMAFGLPTVATPSCGIPEIVVDGSTGYLVPPGDAAAVADAIIRLLTDPDLADRLGAAGRSRVEEQFSWDDVVARMLPALRDAAGGR